MVGKGCLKSNEEAGGTLLTPRSGHIRRWEVMTEHEVGGAFLQEVVHTAGCAHNCPWLPEVPVEGSHKMERALRWGRKETYRSARASDVGGEGWLESLVFGARVIRGKHSEIGPTVSRLMVGKPAWVWGLLGSWVMWHSCQSRRRRPGRGHLIRVPEGLWGSGWDCLA